MTCMTRSDTLSLRSKLLGITKTWLNQPDQRASKQEGVEGFTIRVITSPRRAAATEAELFVAGLLRSKRDGSYEGIINALADFIYCKERKKGAWLLDIGLFGRSLFVSEARRELESGKGVLWEIGTARKDADGVLSNLSRHEDAPLRGDRWGSGGGAQDRGAA